jgi:ketosteroid isomerase-like protein
MDHISKILDEKIDFISHAPTDVFPYLGRRRGRVEVLEALAEVHDKLEVLSFWPLTTVVDGDQAALTVLINVKERTTGKTASFLAAHFLRFRNNLIVECRAIVDSLDSTRWTLYASCQIKRLSNAGLLESVAGPIHGW